MNFMSLKVWNKLLDSILKRRVRGSLCFLTGFTLGWENFLTAGGFSNLLAAGFELKIHPTIRARFPWP